MKPTLIELIPILGMVKYYKRYFKSEKRDLQEAKFANWMSFYYISVNAIFVVLLGYIAQLLINLK